ncbi:zinc finger, PMZ-type containing protein [Tanacetum coccineum]
MLANYEVANVYQLLFMQNNHSKLLVYCGGDVSEGKCAFFKGKKPKDKTNDVDCSTNSDKGDRLDDAECSSKPATKKNGRSSEAIKDRWKTKDMDDDGKITFQRMYICFKGIKQGWLDACRKVVVGVENKDNWAWFLSLLQKDLELGYGGGLTLISDGHKGLLEVVADVLQPLKMDLHNVKNQSFKLEDTLTPSVRKRLELLKDKQRPVPGSKLWKPCDNPTPLPPIQRKRPGRSKKQRIRHPIEDEHHVSRVGMGTSLKSQSVPNSYVDQSRPPIVGSSKKRGSIRIGNSIKRGEENQVTEGGSMDDGNLTAEEYQNKMDMEALAGVERENAAEEAEQERIRQIWAENEANDLYWENMAKEFRDEELLGPKDSLDNAYSFDTISDFQDNELNTRSKIKKQVAATTSIRIFMKNSDRSERIAMIKAKNFKFDANGTGSTADKAFDVSEDEE